MIHISYTEGNLGAPFQRQITKITYKLNSTCNTFKVPGEQALWTLNYLLFNIVTNEEPVY